MSTPDALDPIPHLNAALEDHYRVEREIGEGGMATVYLAEDLKHHRKVAVKVLKPELAAVVGAERFLAEIETTANLQHPHILPLYDSGRIEAGGPGSEIVYFVMPYVEGESLRERLDREKQLPVDEAVEIVRKVAGALDYAHDRGVIHRDIKPANILLHGGEPVVADFGIALAVDAAGGGRLTETGLSLGTPYYMSPEQATGDQPVGPATDIYALGCVLYEMLIGEPPYPGSTAQAVLGKIIQGSPVSAREARPSVPRNVDAVIRRALEKLPADRFPSVGDFGQALNDPGFRHGEALPSGMGRGRGQWTVTATGFATLTAVLAIGLGWALLLPEPVTTPRPTRVFAIDLPEGARFRFNTLQPLGVTEDGESVIVNAIFEGRGSQLFLRPLGSLEMIPIRGTEGIGSFFISPDGEWIGLNTPAETLVRIPVAGGPPATIVETPGSFGAFRGASWGDTGSIVYSIGEHPGLMRVAEVGGVPDTLTTPAAGSGEVHRDPHVVPGGETVLFVVDREDAPTRIAALSTESGEYELLTRGGSPHYVQGGFLVFRREEALWAAAFDPSRRSLTSDPVPVLAEFGTAELFDVAGDGTLVLGRLSEGQLERLAVVDLEGNARILTLAPRTFPNPAVGWSPDGESVVFVSGGQIYTYDLALNAAPRQLTFEGTNLHPVFSPDGGRLAFSSDRGMGFDLFVKNLNSDAPATPILDLDGNQRTMQWPSDTLIVFESGPAGGSDLWMVDISEAENPEARPYLTSEADLRRLSVSPDGGLAAYISDEMGAPGLYVRRFPSPGEPSIVSRGRLGAPNWSPDGTTLYYFGPEQPALAARLARDPVPVVLSRDTLFSVVDLNLSSEPSSSSAIHPDGDRFILTVAASGGTGQDGDSEVSDRLIVVENFGEELMRAVPQ